MRGRLGAAPDVPGSPLVSVVVVSHDGSERLRTLLGGLGGRTDPFDCVCSAICAATAAPSGAERTRRPATYSRRWRTRAGPAAVKLEGADVLISYAATLLLVELADRLDSDFYGLRVVCVFTFRVSSWVVVWAFASRILKTQEDALGGFTQIVTGGSSY